MSVFTASALSGSTNGRPIPVAATGTPGTLIHKASTTGLDEPYAYAHNTTAAAITLTLQFGGVTTSDNIVQSIPANGNAQVLFGERIGAGLEIRAFAPTAGLSITGAVNNIAI